MFREPEQIGLQFHFRCGKSIGQLLKLQVCEIYNLYNMYNLYTVWNPCNFKKSLKSGNRKQEQESDTWEGRDDRENLEGIEDK